MADTSIDLAKNVIINYKDITSWILLVIIIIIGFINYRKDVILSKKIESFKADLTKKEIKFTRHTELQIECLKGMYDHIVTLHFSFVNFLNPPYKTHELLEKQIETFPSDFDQTINFTHRNKILLPEEVTIQMRILHEKYRRIYEICRDETAILGATREYEGPFNSFHEFITKHGEENYITARIENLKKQPDIKTFENDVVKLRELIENYFKTLVS